MTPEQEKLRDEILESALSLVPEEHSSFLERCCGSDIELRTEVERLLRVSREVKESFLEPTGGRAPELDVGRTLGRYQLEGLIGRGGMSIVYRALDKVIGRRVALKVLSAIEGPELRRRFIAELQIMGSVAHDNVVQVYDYGEFDGLSFIVMELLDGEDLWHAFKSGRVQAPGQKLAIARQIATALQHIHHAGVLHRDIKPSNVFLTNSGRVKLMDFGIARLLDVGTEPSATFAGTLEYMSPEQLRGEPYTTRSDIYSFGIFMYEMFTGSSPFAASSLAETVRDVLEKPLPERPLRQAAVPPAIATLIRSCAAKDPRGRPTDLEAVLNQLGGSGQPDPTESSSSNSTVNTGASAISRRVLVILLIACAALPVLYILIFRRLGFGTLASVIFSRFSHRSDSLPRTDSIVVLPFTNVGNDPDLEYLADGLSESITNGLSRLRSVRVIARTTAFTYKGRTLNVRAVGRTLRVKGVVTGRLSRKDGSLRVQVDLIETDGGTQLWGNQYHATNATMLQIEEKVLGQLRDQVRELAEDKSALRISYTKSPEAYDLYLKGRYALSRSSVEDTLRGINFFEKALAIDPRYSLAYTGLADSYWGLSGNYLLPKDAMEKARTAANRALEIDPYSAEARVSLGVINGWYDFSWEKSADELRRAIELKPSDASARLWYGWNLLLNGRFEEGIAQGRLAYERDPLSAFIETGLGQMQYCSGDYRGAVEQLRNVVRTNPSFFPGHYYLGVAYVDNGQYAEAVAELEQAIALDPLQPQPLAYLMYAHAKLGRKNATSRTLSQLRSMAATRYVSGYLFAITAAGLGKTDEIFQALFDAYEKRDDMLSLLGIDHIFAPYRKDQRFRTLLQNLGFVTGA